MSAATTAPVELRDAELAGWHEWARPWPVAIAAVLAAGVTAALTVSAGVLVRPGWFALFAGYSVVAFAGVGLLWRRRRPQSLVGLVLLLLAAALAVVALQGTSWSLGFSIGVLFDPVSALLAWYLLLSYPGVRLTRAAMWVFALAVSTIVVGFVPWYFLSPTISGATFLARCTAECPPNALMIADRPDVATHFATVEEVFRVVFAIAMVALLVSRLVLATQPRRRILAPVYVVGCAWIAVFGLFGAIRYFAVTEQRLWDTLGWFLTGARVALPLAFALALLLARTFAGRSLATMLQRLQGQPTPAALERAAAEALGDPRLRLALRQSEQEDWTDVEGAPIVPAAAEPGRRWRALGSDATERRWAMTPPSTTTPSSSMPSRRPCCSASTGAGPTPSAGRFMPSCRPHDAGSRLRAPPSAAGSSATCTTARSSSWSRCGSTSIAPASVWAGTRSSSRWVWGSSRRCTRSGRSPTAPTRPFSATSASEPR